jgi:hypothetical protein
MGRAPSLNSRAHLIGMVVGNSIETGILTLVTEKISFGGVQWLARRTTTSIVTPRVTEIIIKLVKL